MSELVSQYAFTYAPSRFTRESAGLPPIPPPVPAPIGDITPLLMVVAMAAVEQRYLKWQKVVSRAARIYADRNGLCAEFDRFMVRVGLIPRVKNLSYVSDDGPLLAAIPVETIEEQADKVANNPYWVNYTDPNGDDAENVVMRRLVTQESLMAEVPDGCGDWECSCYDDVRSRLPR